MGSQVGKEWILLENKQAKNNFSQYMTHRNNDNTAWGKVWKLLLRLISEPSTRAILPNIYKQEEKERMKELKKNYIRRMRETTGNLNNWRKADKWRSPASLWQHRWRRAWQWEDPHEAVPEAGNTSYTIRYFQLKLALFTKNNIIK